MAHSSYLLFIYLIYTLVSLALVSGLARTLFRNGDVFLADVFESPEMAAAVNRLLVVGFFMFNLGYAFLIFRTNEAASAVEATEVLVTKLGMLLVSLGVVHFLNLAVFAKIRQRHNAAAALPVPPAAYAARPPIPVVNYTGTTPTAG